MVTKGGGQTEEKEEEHIEMTRKVVDLLVEMVECCDIILLNKTDRLEEGEAATLLDIVTELNSSATVHPCTFGQVKQPRPRQATP